ncbi:MAG TPA: GntR family transcriptional regulator [Nocardioidaceae bacterium]|jgi:DNA-binding transcriptional regulator YhcF (GntR family)|nr:GntR family transcriptional regulator [Nocardioidaceae bacterium]
MDDIAIDHDSAVPPFEQLRAQIAGLVNRGELAPGTRLPTVRKTAEDLGLAVNTVARAYRELEADGVVVTEGRRGTFVRSAVVDGTAGGADAAREAAVAYVRTARRAGLTRAEALRLVEATWA